MSTLSIITTGPELLPLRSSVLRRQADYVAIDDPGVLKYCERIALDMFELMYAADGAGLAAPQVGISLRLIVVDPSNIDFGPHVLINPEIISRSEEKDPVASEGCLSIPLYSGRISRSKEVHLRTHDLKGNVKEYKATGWLARVFQHELDHLDGVLYPDHLEADQTLTETSRAPVRRAMRAMRLVEEKEKNVPMMGTR